MRERAVRFGDAAELVGVLTGPEGAAGGGDRPAVVLLNSGILHRVGASRLHVQIARSLAEAGFSTFRFDFSGIGDSQVRRDDLSFEESAKAETRSALDYMAETTGSDEIVLGGLCSGADVAFRVATEDARVVGLAQLDAWPYRTWKSLWKHYAPRLLDPRQWMHSIRVRLEELGSRLGSEDEDGDAPDYITPEYRRQFPPRSEVRQGLETLMERNVYLYYFFSGNYGGDYNYREQYRDAFPEVDFGERLTVDYDPEADHIVTGLPHQRFVVEAIRGWVRKCWVEGRPVQETVAMSGEDHAIEESREAVGELT